MSIFAFRLSFCLSPLKSTPSHRAGATLEKAGYEVERHDMEDLSGIRRMANVPDGLEGCHAAALDGCFLEGHVPLEAIRKLQTERPRIAGLAVPGMPPGSLGMGEDGSARYNVVSVKKDGAVATYMTAGRCSSLLLWLERSGGAGADCLFPSRVDHTNHMSTRRYCCPSASGWQNPESGHHFTSALWTATRPRCGHRGLLLPWSAIDQRSASNTPPAAPAITTIHG